MTETIQYPDDYDQNDVDTRVDLRTKNIRNAIYGGDVRNAIAQGVEIGSVVSGEAKSTANAAKTQSQNIDDRFNDQIAGSTNDNELIDYRHSDMLSKTFSTAKLRGDFVDTSLQQLGVNIRWFGAVCDGVTDDSKALQSAIDHCFENGGHIMVPKTKIAIKSTVYIPVNADQDKRYTYDFNDCTFILPGDGTLFASGIKNGDAYTDTSSGDDIKVNYNFNIRLKNFHIEGGKVGLKLSSYHEGCSISNITSDGCLTLVDCNNMYYCEFSDISTVVNNGDRVNNPERFIFHGVSNLMTIEKCVAAESKVGYFFDGYDQKISSLRFLGNSIEGTVIGVKVLGQLTNSLFDGTYCENVDKFMFDLSEVQLLDATRISNSWVNFGDSSNAYFINQAAFSGVNRLTLRDNHYEGKAYSEDKIFANKQFGGGATMSVAPYTAVSGDLVGTVVQQGTYPGNMLLDQKVVYGSENETSHGPLGHRSNVYAVGNYSGKMTDGSSANLIGLEMASAWGGTIILQTAIFPSDQQYILLSFRCTQDSGTDYFTNGLIVGTRYYEFGSNGLTLNDKVTIDNSKEFVLITFNTGLIDFTNDRTTAKGGFARLI